MTFFPSRPASAACSGALDGVRASTLPQPHPFSARACRTLRECAGSSLTRGLRPLPAPEPCVGRPGASREMDLRPEQPPLAWDPLLGVLACSCRWTNLPLAKLRCRVPICAPCTRSFAMTFFP